MRTKTVRVEIFTLTVLVRFKEKTMLIEPYRFQKEGILLIQQKGGNALVADSMGLGKEQPVDTKVLTPTGWVEIGSLKIGDTLIGSQGTPIKVTGVFPQGIKKSYRLHFHDGSSVEAGDEHLWKFHYRKGQKSIMSPFPGLLTTEELRLKPVIEGINLAKTTLYLPLLQQPVEFREKEIPIDPYLMGALLANGALGESQSMICLTTNAKDSEQILNRFKKNKIAFSKPRYYKNVCQISIPAIRTVINDLGLKCLSKGKFIPDCYLFNSVENRIALLHGLMDGDGSITSTRNRVTYHTISKTLAKNVKELVQSLGGIASVRTYYRIKENKPTEYQVRIRLPLSIPPFWIKRKLDRWKPGSRCLPRRILKSVEYKRKVESVCIAVDAEDRLYVTEDYILTHNSMQALGWVEKFLPAGPGIILIVCPASVKWNWQKEVKKFLGRDSTVLESRTAPELDVLPDGIYIINYDIIRKNKHDPEAGWLPFLLYQNIRVIIGDEIQAIQNIASKQTKAFWQLCADVPYKIFLSGTPFTNNVLGLFPALHLLRPDKFPSRSNFAFRYCEPKHRPWGWEFKGATNTKELNGLLLDTVMIRRLKEDVLKDLPPKTISAVPLEMSDRKKYDELEADYVTWLSKHHPTKLTRALRAEKLTQQAYLRRTAAELKWKAGIQWLKLMVSSLGEGKIIVFSFFRSTLFELHKEFKDICVSVDGSITGLERQRRIEQFQENPKVRMMNAQLDAMHAGWNGQVASHVVILEMGWSPAKLLQAADRANRIGSTFPTSVYYPYAIDSIEEDLAKVSQLKQFNSDKVLDGLEEGGDYRVWDLVSQQLQERVSHAKSQKKGHPPSKKHRRTTAT